MSEPTPGRRDDIVRKQNTIAALLGEHQRDGLLILDPSNFSWLTSGATARGVVDLAEHPALFMQNATYRWIVCSNVDTQRIFDEEIDGLGFQLKEWPWAWGRQQLLNDLCHGKRLACDVPFGDCSVLGDALRAHRRRLSPWEQSRLFELGRQVSHAVEATGRNFVRGETEEEIAGQLSHRLLHRGLEPVSLLVSADGRLRNYRRHGPTSARAEWSCVIQATARKFGLHVTTSRVVSFGEPNEQFRREIEAASRWTAVLISGTVAGALLADVLERGNRYLQLAGFEHEWQLAPLGRVSGHAFKELDLLPGDRALRFEPGWAVVWHGSIGAVTNADTVLVGEEGMQVATPIELWPTKRIKVAGQAIDRPDVLIRDE